MIDLCFLRPITVKGKIRLGNRSDGGYVLYERLLGQADALVTYGVGWDISFEEQFNRLTGKPVIMFDPTMFGKHLLNSKRLKQYLLSFRFGAGAVQLIQTWKLWRLKKKMESRQVFFVNEGIAARRQDRYDTLGHHLERFQLTEKRLVLKMDIEGGEYNILADKATYKHFEKADQLIIEFHDLKRRLRDLRAICGELALHFSLVHIHGNNCGPTFTLYDLDSDMNNDVQFPDVLELVWVRSDRLSKEDISDERISYPVAGLDFPNDPNRKDYSLDAILATGQ